MLSSSMGAYGRRGPGSSSGVTTGATMPGVVLLLLVCSEPRLLPRIDRRERNPFLNI